MIERHALETVIVDGTAQSKTVSRDTLAEAQGVELKQTYAKESRDQVRKAGRYARINCYQSIQKVVKHQRIIFGCFAPDIQYYKLVISTGMHQAPNQLLVRDHRVTEQSWRKKTLRGKHKIHSWCALEGECMGKRNAHNPYDSQTLAEQLDQSSILLQDTSGKPKGVYIDLGCRCMDQRRTEYELKHRAKVKHLTLKEH